MLDPKVFLWDCLSRVSLPREVVLINWKLGVVFKLLQAGAFVGAIYILRTKIHKEYRIKDPVLEFWKDGARAADNVSDLSVLHCVSPDQYHYNFSTDRRHTPTQCKASAEAGGDYVKSGQTLFFATLRSEETSRRSSGAAGCSALRSTCLNSWKAAYSEEANYDSCECRHTDEFFIQNQELHRVSMKHSYFIEKDDSGDVWESGSSSIAKITEKTKEEKFTVPGVVVTRVMSEDNTICELSGKKEWLPGEGDITGSIEEWIACGQKGLSLDHRSNLTRSKDASGPAPYLRVTGVKVVLNLRYSNDHDLEYRTVEVENDEASPEILQTKPKVNKTLPVRATCDIIVGAYARWNVQIRSDTTLLPDGDALDTDSQTLVVYSYGVTFEFGGSGTFKFFDFLTLLDGIIQAIVLLGIPVTIVRFLAKNNIGVVSEIYSFAMEQKFNIFDQFHGLAARMMTTAIGFRGITGQFDVPVDKLKPINHKFIEDRMLETFEQEMGADTHIQEEEIRRITQVVVAGIDESGEGEVSYDEFLRASSANEFVGAKDMLKFFDEQRKPGFLERLLDTTTKDIRNHRPAQIEAEPEVDETPKADASS